MKPDITQFDQLSNSALVSIKTVAMMTGEGISTVWRKARTDTRLTPVRLGNRCTRYRVGGVRAYMRGEVTS